MNRKCFKMFVFFIVLAILMKGSTQFQLIRVIDGTPTTISNYPILAQLLLDTWGNQQFAQYCAGVILTSRHVLSTAHCFQFSTYNGKNYTDPKYWRVRVGSTYRNKGGSLHKVKMIIPHYGFHNYYYTDDIAVLVVSRPFALGDNIRQATLPKLGAEIKPNSLCVLLGWGATSAVGPQPDQLQQTSMFTVDQQECFQRYNTIKAVITNSMMCAGKLDVGGADACFGDSGGPLVYKGFVVGLVSFGKGCGDSYYPGVYTKISHYSDWILKTVAANR